MKQTIGIRSLYLLFVVLTVSSCSTKKNTSQSRWWQAFNTRYNVYYNGNEAYIAGSLEKEKGNKDNFTEFIPLYTVGNKNSQGLGKSNYDVAITKSQKAIQLHSIKKRPIWDKKRRKTEKDIEWLSRREYNPFMWKVWLLMGRSQFQKGNFGEAASTFSYMSRLYRTQPHIYGKARAWLAKTYTEEGWLNDAEDVIRNMQRDSIDWRAVKEWDYTLANYHIHTEEYEKAIPYLQKVIKHEMRRVQRAREWYLLGQMYYRLDKRTEAYKAFKKVVSLNPPYELAFNARISMSEVMANREGKKMISRLRRMTVSDNNKEYLDQIYYAIGNIYLIEKDTLKAISAYEKGVKDCIRNGIEKGVLQLKLGDIYYNKGEFVKASKHYNGAISLLDKDRAGYQQLQERTAILNRLTPHLQTIHLQDSLQNLVQMSEIERNAAIDRVIEALKQQEKVEKRALQEAEALQNTNTGEFSNTNNIRNNPTFRPNNNSSNVWYFYNPLTVSQGKSTFRQQWGNRQNIDFWQISNRNATSFTDNNTLTDEQRDSIFRENTRMDSLSFITQTDENNPHKRAYYLEQLPFTEEKKKESDRLLYTALYNSGVIFKDEMNLFVKSKKDLTRIENDNKNFEGMADVYYHLFLLYYRMGQFSVADRYVEKLKSEYPQNQWTQLLSDPQYEDNARSGKHLEDSLYTKTYEAFKKGNYNEVLSNSKLSEERFPLGSNRDKFVFIEAISLLGKDNAIRCTNILKDFSVKYPNSTLKPLAESIIKGINEGRALKTANISTSDIWAMRSNLTYEKNDDKANDFTDERNIPFTFVIAYRNGTIDENQLLFQLARYNFTSYLVRNFMIEREERGDSLRLMKVQGFRSYDEALQYSHSFYEQKDLINITNNVRRLVISEQNLKLLAREKSIDEYNTYYLKHFAPLKVSTYNLLAQPEEQIVKDMESEIPANTVQPTRKQIEQVIEDNTYIIEETDNNVKTQRQSATSNANSKSAPTTQQKNNTTKTTEVPKKSEPVKVNTTKPVKTPKKVVKAEDEYYDMEGF